MDIYETIYLISETTQLLGNAFMDTLSVIFALMVTGYLVGLKLTRSMVWGLITLSAIFVLPMILVVRDLLARADALGDSLPKGQFDTLPYLDTFVTSGAGFAFGGPALVISLGLAYVAAVYFVVHCHAKGIVAAGT